MTCNKETVTETHGVVEQKTNGTRSSHSTEESQVPWDTGGLTFLHRPEGKSIFMERRMWGIILGMNWSCAMGHVAYWTNQLKGNTTRRAAASERKIQWIEYRDMSCSSPPPVPLLLALLPRFRAIFLPQFRFSIPPSKLLAKLETSLFQEVV